MALKVNTATQDFDALDAMQNDWVYNALDCCQTSEIYTALKPHRTPLAQGSYDFVRAMQAPSLAMSMRGMAIDMERRTEWICELQSRMAHLERVLNKMAQAVWDRDLNPRSWQQLEEFFYGTMKLPIQYKYDKNKKQRVPTTDDKALSALGGYFYARPMVKTIQRIRQLNKKLGTLRSGVDDDNRMRTSYNVSGTETGRWSSNKNTFGTGTNLQNWTNELREIFVADAGYKIAYVDLEQAESRAVAYLAQDDNYIKACESGDLHTDVASMLWPDAEPEQIRKEKFYGIHTRRDLAKRCGHGTNYYGKPRTIALHTGDIEPKVVEEFQERYFDAFPGIPKWHQSVATELQTTSKIVTPTGRERVFFSRTSDDATLREAIAFAPQSTVAELLNLGMYAVWKKLDIERGCVKLMLQVHDAILVQYAESEDELALLAEVVELLQQPCEVHGRIMTIPAAVEGVGWNWRKYDPDHNINGLKDLKGKPDERVRYTLPKETTLLHRLIC